MNRNVQNRTYWTACTKQILIGAFWLAQVISTTARKDCNVIECVNCQACWNGWNELDSALADSEVITFVGRCSASILFSFIKGQKEEQMFQQIKVRYWCAQYQYTLDYISIREVVGYISSRKFQEWRLSHRLLSSLDITLELRWQHWRKHNG